MRALRIDTEGKTDIVDAGLDSIRQSVGVEELGHASLNGTALDALEVHPDIGITMWLDDLAYLRQERPAPNFLATGLHGTGDVVLGNVVLQAYDRRDGETADLPQSVIDELGGPKDETV